MSTGDPGSNGRLQSLLYLYSRGRLDSPTLFTASDAGRFQSYVTKTYINNTMLRHLWGRVEKGQL